MQVEVPEAGSGRFRNVGSGRSWKVPERGSGEFRCGLLPCQRDRSSHVIRMSMLLLLGIPPKLIFGRTAAACSGEVLR